MRPLFYLLFIIIITGCGELERSRNEMATLSGVEVEAEKEIPAKKVKKKEPVIRQKATQELIELGLTQDILNRSAVYDPSTAINLKKGGFIYAGKYFEKEDNCETKMYKKEYEVTWLYIHIDCEGNRTKYHKDK